MRGRTGEGPRVVVVLGASSGIGRATAEEFARRGDRVVLAGRTAESLEEVAAACTALGAEALVVPADVTARADIRRLVAAAVERFGRIDVWVGAASVYAYALAGDTTEEVFDRMLAVNVAGQARGVRAVLPVLDAQGGGVIVLIGSVFSRIAAPYVSAYVASKHAIQGYANALRQEVRPAGIRVVLVLPATIDTPIHQHAANLTGRRVRPLPPVAGPRRVARAIVRTASWPRRTVRVGMLQWLAVPLQRVAPPLYDRIMRAAWNRIAVTDEPEPPHTGNLFASSPAGNAVTGGWRPADGVSPSRRDAGRGPRRG